MRVALASLLALAAGASALAQTPSAPTPAASPPAGTASPIVQTPAPGVQAPAPSVPAPTAGAPAAVPAAAPAETAPTPPPPPAPPTDPVAIELLNILQQVCIPATSGGDFAKLAKATGFRKNSDETWTLRQKVFSLTLESPGSNPTQCHVEVTHPADPDSPGRPIVIALNDWAAIERGWSLYRNDKSVQDGLQFITRSWQHDADGQEQSLVFTTQRKPDGSPLRGGLDQSELIYGVTRLAS